MFTFFRRWLAGDPPGSPSNPKRCGTPFLTEGSSGPAHPAPTSRPAAAAGRSGRRVPSNTGGWIPSRRPAPHRYSPSQI